MALCIKKITSNAILPTRAHPDDAGLDLYSSEYITLKPGEGTASPTGISLAIPKGHVGLMADRSSLAKRGIKIAGGVIDAGYRGEIRIVLWNISQETIILNAGERIAQLMILPIITPSVVEVEVLDDTSRGTGGFGSTGK